MGVPCAVRPPWRPALSRRPLRDHGRGQRCVFFAFFFHIHVMNHARRTSPLARRDSDGPAAAHIYTSNPPLSVSRARTRRCEAATSTAEVTDGGGTA